MSKDLLQVLRERGLTDYGSFIPGSLVLSTIGLQYPAMGTKSDFDKISLRVIAAIDYVRSALLNEGKYIAGQGEDFRVLLPSENQRQIDAYLKQAEQKLRRGLKLYRNTPLEAKQLGNANTQTRLVMKLEDTRRHRCGG